MQDSVEKPSDTFTFSGKPFLFGFITFILLSVIFGILVYQRYLLVIKSKEKEAIVVLHEVKAKLQETLVQSRSAAKILSFFIDGDGQVKYFDSIAAQILETANGIDALQLVPDGIIQYVYPLKGNETVLGYNILKDTSRNKEAYKAITKKEMFFAGPFELRQGGFGVVGRLPVYRKNKFWGFSAVIIKMGTLFKAAGINSTGVNGRYFQLSKLNPVTAKEEFFLPQQKNLPNKHDVSVHVPNGDWKLSLTTTTSYSDFEDNFILAILGFLFSFLGGLFVNRTANRPQVLNQLVINRTRELKISEHNYRSLIERVSDAFISLDNNWNYTYVNKKAGELIKKDPVKILGKNIWDEFPNAIDKPYYHAYKNAMERQQYQFIEEYYPALNKWYENHIYPSSDGLTIFFKDVTRFKDVTNALKEKEEKYRTLIEQASDGIVITDLDGNILEVNKSIADLCGYSIDEMPGKHLYYFLPKEDTENNPLRFKELMEGKSLLYERKLLKKDGSLVDVEVNSKMASSQTLIGFIRDITERKKHEAALQYQARLLQNVSDAITSFDMNRCIVSWNKACEDLYGFTAEEALGKRVPELVTFEFPDSGLEEMFKQLFSIGYWKGEFNFIHPKTNEKVYLLSNLNVLKNEHAEITGFILTSKNITYRIKAEDQLKKSNERFELIAQSTNDAVWDQDFLLNEIWGNNQLYKLYDVETGKQKINFEMFLERIHPDDREGIVERMKTAIAGKANSIVEEFRFKTATGEYRFFYDRAYIKYDAAGNPLRILGAMQDITERKKAAEEILLSKKQFQNLVENISGVYWVNNLDTYETLYVSPSYETIWGLKTGDLYKNPEDFINAVHPGDKAALREAHKNMGNTLKASTTFRIIRPDGETRWILAKTNVVPDNKGRKIEYGYAEDITERKNAAEELFRSEQKYKLLFYNNPLPMWMTTLPGLDIIDVNEAAIKQYGYSREEFLKLNTRLLRPPEDVENFLKEVDKMEPDMINIRSWRHKKKDGTIIQVETYSHEIIYEGKRTWLGLSHDVTEKYEARVKLQKSYEDIRQLATNLQSIREDERTSIAREIHDELGQQLTGLKMDLHWLSRKINSSDPRITGKMQESMALINATIVSVRKISTDLRPSILDDLGLLSALEWQGEDFEKRSGTRVEFINMAGEITVQPEAATGIFRIYQELLTNIARHANATSVKARLYKDESRLYFSISDNGVGFNLETIHNKKTLGLLGIKERTLIFEGTYDIKSKPGEGCVTTISIPLNFVTITE